MQILSEKGVTNAAALLGGTQAWEKAGYPMESTEEKPNQNKDSKDSKNANVQNSSAKKELNPTDN